MCLTYCHVKDIVYDSDTDEVCGVCSYNLPAPGKGCYSCRYRRESTCTLTQSPLPSRNWCCHLNAKRQTGWVVIRPAQIRGTLRFLGEKIWILYDVTSEPNGDGRRVHLPLSIPMLYGVPTVHWADEMAAGECEVWEEENLPESENWLVL